MPYAVFHHHSRYGMSAPETSRSSVVFASFDEAEARRLELAAAIPARDYALTWYSTLTVDAAGEATGEALPLPDEATALLDRAVDDLFADLKR
jgi:hypothetical protein